MAVCVCVFSGQLRRGAPKRETPLSGTMRARLRHDTNYRTLLEAIERNNLIVRAIRLDLFMFLVNCDVALNDLREIGGEDAACQTPRPVSTRPARARPIDGRCDTALIYLADSRASALALAAMC